MIPLTTLAKTAGCAAKIAQVDLHAALAHLPRPDDPRVLVGLDTDDDAAVLRLTDDLALVETVDIFTPIVDDPYDYGRIAAANALSDIYAMGATPLSALSFIAWPVATLGTEPLGRVLEGAAAVCAHAGIAIAGGHSIVDEEPKFGLFVTGLVHPQRVVTNAGAQPGDVLVLTKPLGTGVLTTAVKRGHLDGAALTPAVRSMTTLNRAAAEAMVEVGVHAATDVTGFGLLGHLGNLLRASSARSGRPLGAHLRFREIPLFEGVLELAARDVCPGGSKRNLAYAAPHTRFGADLAPHEQLLCADAQTSGGLLIAVPGDRKDALVRALRARDVPTIAAIGAVADSNTAGEIEVV
jgi:selenide,water dikinase